DRRRSIAEAARSKMANYTFEQLWQEQLARIEQEWPALVERARQRPSFGGHADLLARTWQALSSSQALEPNLVADLAAAVVQEPQAAALHNALGLATVRSGVQSGGPWP